VAAQPVYELTRATAEQTLDTAGYVAAVAPVSTTAELIPQPPSLGERRGLPEFPLSFQERGLGNLCISLPTHV
jgi:hypothetical protein